jgi:hypothetical protein
MMFRSRYPDADIPSVFLTEFVLGAPTPLTAVRRA